MAYKQPKCISHSSGAEGPRSGCQQSGFDEGPLLGCVLTRQKRGETVLWDLFYKGTNPIQEGSTLDSRDLNISQSPHFLIASHWGLGFQHTDFEGTQTFSPL